MTIKVTYNVTDVYMSQSVSPVYINVSYSDGGASGGGVWGSITGTLSNQTDLQTALDLKVPYSGATGDVSLGEYGINVGNVIYDTTPTGIPTEQGATYWDADAETVALIMNGTIQKVGEDTFYHVRNTTGSTIAKGTAVRFSGTTGNSGRLLIAPMLADGTYPSQYYMGITSEELVNNADGKVYHFGKMRNINTSAFADGDVLYVSPSVAGALTATAPVAPNNIIVAAAVVHAANNGTLMIRTTLGSNINSDEGVLLTTPSANQGLFYDSGLWVNKSITSALGYTPVPTTRNITINGVTYDLSADRTYTISTGISGSGASGQVTYWTGASAVSGSNNLFWDNANGRLGIGTNAPTAPLHIVSTTSVGSIITSTQDNEIQIRTTGTNNAALCSLSSGNGTTSGRFAYFMLQSLETSPQRWDVGMRGAKNLVYYNSTLNSAALTIDSANNNIYIGTSSALGVRFGVVGDTLLRGSGNTSATTALTVQNSGSTAIFRVRNDGEAFGLNTSTLSFGTFVSQRSNASSSGTARAFWGLNTFGPTTGNAEWNSIHLQLTLTQGGTATGISRGLFVDTTLTSAVDYRAIETTAGNVLFGSNFFWDNANGRLGIGTNAPITSLHVIGTSVVEGINCSFAVATSNANVNGSQILFRVGDSGGGNYGTFATFTNRNTASSVAFALRVGDAGSNGVNFSLGNVTNQDQNFYIVMRQTSNINVFKIDTSFNSHFNYGVTIGSSYFSTSAPTNGLSVEGNTLIGTSSSLGTRLGVVGDTLLRGSGATSATTALTVQNSSSTNLFTVRNDGRVTIRNSYIEPYQSFSANDAIKFVSNNIAAAIGVQNENASGYSGIEYLNNAGVVKVFTGFYNLNGTEFRFNNIATNGYTTFMINSTSAMTIKTNRQVRFHPLSSAPAGAEAGDVYYNSTDNKHYGYNGTTWNAFY